MNSLAALSAGGRQSMRLFKITALFYAMNPAMAAVIVAPLAVAVAGNLSRSLESARLFSNFDVGWLMEFSYQYRGGDGGSVRGADRGGGAVLAGPEYVPGGRGDRAV